MPARVLGLTGSCGKTTTKDMMRAILERVGPTLATEGNLNNHIGVPFTLFGLRPEHRFAVVEMGCNHPGEIAALAARHDCLVLEDACHALASSYGGIPVGSCRHSALTVFSFHPVKHITTGEGGAITTNDRGLRDRLARLRNHGIVRDLPSAPPWFYDVVEVGYNFRLTDLQAALGLAQLGRSDHFLQRRRDLVRIYQDLLAGDRDLTLTLARLGTEPSWHLLVARLTDPFLREHKAKLFALCATAGVRLQVHYVPIHYHTCFVERFGRPSLPACEDYYRAALSLPIFPELEDGQVAEVVAVVRGAIAELREEQA